MTSVDSGVETGNDSNDSVIVQHESQQQQQPHGIISNQNIDNSVATVATINSNEMDSSKQELFHIDLRIREPINLMSNPRNSIEFYLASNRESLLMTDHRIGVRMSNPEVMPERRNTYKTGRNIYSVFDRRAARLKRYGGMNYASVDFRARRYSGRKMRLGAATDNIMYVEQLLKEGVSPNISDDYGRTPLHHAASRGFTDMVRLLLHYGANPNQQDCAGNTPLQLAAVTRKIPTVTLLLSASTILPFKQYDVSPLRLIQTKLDMLKNVKTDEDLGKLKQEIESIMTRLDASAHMKENMREQMETLSNACSHLSLSNSDKVQDDIKDLLANASDVRITNRPGYNMPP